MSPPPGPMPPGLYAPAPRPRRRIGLWIFLLLMLIGSVLLNLILLALAIGGSSRGRAIETVMVEGDASQRIAVVPVHGVIMDDSSGRFNEIMKSVEADENVRALVIEIDSPGGTITASDEIHHRIEVYRQSTQARGLTIPIVVFQRSLATSGGYYVSCASDYIVAQPTTLTGNIGVLMSRINLAKFGEKWGIEDTTLRSSGSEYKDAGSMWRPESPEEKVYFTTLLDDMYRQFTDVVKNGRSGRLNTSIAVVADGKVHTAGQALQFGLIDQIGYEEDVYAYIKSKTGIINPQVVRFDLPQPGVLELLAGVNGRAPTPSANGGTTINGINVNVDGKLLHELQTPRAMYIWDGYFR